MGKVRTKKEKGSANYKFILRLNEIGYKPHVNFIKNDSTSPAQKDNQKETVKKNGKKMAKKDYFINIKKDIFKSLTLTTFILILELVLYLALR